MAEAVAEAATWMPEILEEEIEPSVEGASDFEGSLSVLAPKALRETVTRHGRPDGHAQPRAPSLPW
jgi:hypothetical protein